MSIYLGFFPNVTYLLFPHSGWRRQRRRGGGGDDGRGGKLDLFWSRISNQWSTMRWRKFEQISFGVGKTVNHSFSRGKVINIGIQVGSLFSASVKIIIIFSLSFFGLDSVFRGVWSLFWDYCNIKYRASTRQTKGIGNNIWLHHFLHLNEIVSRTF